MRSVAIAVSSLLTLGAATSALADGMASGPAPTPVARDGWSGLYIGLGGGGSRVDASASTDTDYTFGKDKCTKGEWEKGKFVCTKWTPVGKPYHYSDHASFSDDDWKPFGTIQVGYDRLFHDRLLIGAFADVDIYGGDGSSFGDKYHSASFDISHTWNFGGRLGALVRPDVLVYGVGGYTRAGGDGSFQTLGAPTLDHFDTLQGWFAGGGTEVKIRHGVALKFEYRWADYGSASAEDSLFKVLGTYRKWCDLYRATYSADSKADVDLQVQSVRAAVVFRLDEPDRPVALK
jgi:opacity protein-like surface antigen